MRSDISTLCRVARGRGGRLGGLAIVDQCLVSGTNFFTVVLVGRYAGATELGLYALAFSLVMLVIGLQRSFLISPYVVVRDRFDEERTKAIRGSILVATLVMGATCSLLMLPASLLTAPGLGLAMVVALPAGLMRDFGRRIAIVDSRMFSALTIDLSIATLQLGLLWLLASASNLDATRTLLVCSAVWFLVGLIGLAISRRQYAVRVKSLRDDLSLIWPIGRWIGMSQVLSTIQAFALPWLMALVHSVELAGIYAACWTLVQIVSPAIEGLGNVLGPAFSKSASKSSWNDLAQRVRVSTGVFALLMGILVLSVFLFGQLALTKIYGAKFGEYYATLVVLALASSINHVGIPAGKALTQLGRERLNFWNNLASLMTTIVVAFLCLKFLGTSGAAWGLVAGGCVSSAAKWVAFLNLCASRRSQDDAIAGRSRSLPLAATAEAGTP